MDQQACWKEICPVVEERRREDLESSVEAMLAWLDKGGSPPLVSLHLGQLTCIANREVLAMFVRTLCREFLVMSRMWPTSP